MSDPKVGKIGWIDLSVPNAETIRDFYHDVVGWNAVPLSMGDYNDYCMMPPGEEDAAAGICHTIPGRELPASWLVYITVANLETSLEACRRAQGTVLMPPREAGGGSFAVIKDPAGAVCALYQHPPQPA